MRMQQQTSSGGAGGGGMYVQGQAQARLFGASGGMYGMPGGQVPMFHQPQQQQQQGEMLVQSQGACAARIRRA